MKCIKCNHREFISTQLSLRNSGQYAPRLGVKAVMCSKCGYIENYGNKEFIEAFKTTLFNFEKLELEVKSLEEKLSESIKAFGDIRFLQRSEKRKLEGDLKKAEQQMSLREEIDSKRAQLTQAKTKLDKYATELVIFN
jgi:predicted nucleic-acid-binding Zn-ribbon protein